MIEKSKSLCYFLTFDDGKLQVKDHELKQLDEKELNGLYSFIHYNQPRLMVVGALQDYGSQHSGLASIVESLKKQWQILRNSLFFFNKLSELPLPQEQPTAGGGLFILNGVVVLWHLKSGSYSLDNDSCHDDSPLLDELIEQVGLPADCFISVEQAEQFERDYLRYYFDANGKLLNESLALELAENVSEIIKSKKEQFKKHLAKIQAF